MKKEMIKLTQIRSIHGRQKRHQACVAGLGLRRIGHTVEVEDTPSGVLKLFPVHIRHRASKARSGMFARFCQELGVIN